MPPKQSKTKSPRSKNRNPDDGFPLEHDGTIKSCVSGRDKGSWSKKELKGIAASMGVNIPSAANKGEICDTIAMHLGI